MRDFHWLAVGTQRIFAALQHLQYANSATAIRARRFSCPNTVQKMLAFSSQRFFFGKKYRVTAVLVCNGNSVSPIDTMGIEHKLVFSLNIIKYCHLAAANDRQFLLFKGVQPAYENMRFYAAL